MVRASVGPLAAQILYKGEELRGVVFVGAGFHAVVPGSLVGLVDVLLNMLVKEGETGFDLPLLNVRVSGLPSGFFGRSTKCLLPNYLKRY